MHRIDTTAHRLYLFVLAALLFAAGCASAPPELTPPKFNLYGNWEPAMFSDSDILPVADSPTLGPASAPVTLLLFQGYGSGICEDNARQIAKLREAYPRQLKVVHRGFILFRQFPHQKTAARAAMAAHQQGRFWQMNAWLCEQSDNLRHHVHDMKEWSAAHAEAMGLDVARYKQDFDAPETRRRVERDIQEASRVFVRMVPTGFFNGERLPGLVYPASDFDAIIERQLDQAQRLADAGVPLEEIYQAAVAENFDVEHPHFEANSVEEGVDPQVEFVPVEADDPTFGTQDGPLVTIVIFLDYRCVGASWIDDTLERVRQAYGDQARLVFKARPKGLDLETKPASRALLAAHQQGKYEQMRQVILTNHRAYWEHSGDFERTAIAFAGELDLDITQFQKDYHSDAISEQIDRDVELAEELSAIRTPNIWINGFNLRGAHEFENFKAIIDAQIERAQKLKAAQNISGDALYKRMVELNTESPPPLMGDRPNCYAPHQPRYAR